MSSIHRLLLEHKISELSCDLGGSCIDLGGKRMDQYRQPFYSQFANVSILNIDKMAQPDYEMPIEDYVAITHNFDVVVAFEVAEYLTEPRVLFSAVYHLLKGDGKAILSFPSVMAQHGDYEFDKWRFQLSAILEMAESHGFSLKEVIPLGNIFTVIYDLIRARFTYLSSSQHSVWSSRGFGMFSRVFWWIFRKRLTTKPGKVVSGYLIVLTK